MNRNVLHSMLVLLTLITGLHALCLGVADRNSGSTTLPVKADVVRATAEPIPVAWCVDSSESTYRWSMIHAAASQPLVALLAMQTSGSSARQDHSPPSIRQPEKNPIDRLVRKTDLRYLGAFRFPAGSDQESFKYGGTALAYHAAKDSLFVVGHDHHQRIGEISIPEIRKGKFSELAMAKSLQPLHDVLSRIPRKTLEGEIKIGGMLINNGKLIGTAFEYYDANQNAMDSHFKFPGTKLSDVPNGFFKLVGVGSGYVAGYMATVPPEWQARLGGKALTGQAGIPIIGRTSVGPAAFAFDPETIGPKAPLKPLLYYTLEHPLAPPSEQNNLFNLTSDVIGAVFPEGTASVLFFGKHGTGPYWYGEADSKDPAQPYRGSHAPPYEYYVWHYDARQLEGVANRAMRPWEVMPKVWTLDLPYAHASRVLGGACWDARRRRIFLSAFDAGPSGESAVHVFELH